MKRFNVTGTCFADRHYMVNIDERIQKIKKMVDRGDYFCINRGRQYGKTTTLHFLKKALDSEYTVFSISFEGSGDKSFESLDSLVNYFFNQLMQKCFQKDSPQISSRALKLLKQITGKAFFKIKVSEKNVDFIISDFCRLCSKPIVIIIDEVDQAGNYPSFIKFLSLLRKKYLEREENVTFHSVILAGVYDIKNLKLKIRPDENHQYNSPWNIAANFNINMALEEDGIHGMLEEYERDNCTGMDTQKMAKQIWDYTSGYPFLVSRLCQIMDEDLEKNWSDGGFLEAVKRLLNESNTLFDDIRKKLDDFPIIRRVVTSILFNGEAQTFNAYDKGIDIARMLNFIKSDNGKIAVSNRIFEIWFYNLFVSESTTSSLKSDSEIIREGSIDKPTFIRNGHLDMKKILERFCVHFNEIYDTKDEKFIERQGRKFFLFFLKPIINGTGNYYVEAETRDERRMDVVVDYAGERFVVEMKIWRGESYNERGEQQLSDYLDYYGLDCGYLLSFCFNKNKIPGIREVTVQTKRGEKNIVEAVV